MGEYAAALPTEAVAVTPTDKDKNIRTKVVTASVLAGLATTAFFGEKYGLNARLPEVGTEVANSCAHPIVGYMGAWVATKVIKRFKPGASLAGATVADFVAEKSQSLLLTSPYYNFLSQQYLPETVKDYAFALGGSLLFMAQDRQRPSPKAISPTPFN
jgi:hypothetical protein